MLGFSLPDDWYDHLPAETKTLYDNASENGKRAIKDAVEEILPRASLQRNARDPESWIGFSHALKLTAEIYRRITEKEDFQLFNLVSPRGKDDDKIDAKAAALKTLVGFYSLKCTKIDVMLFGLSVELLIKAILIAQNPDFVTKDGLDDKIAKHNLLALIETANIEIDKEERKILRDLQQYIEWMGRYPIPKKFNKAVNAKTSLNIDLLNALYRRLEKHPKLIELEERKVRNIRDHIETTRKEKSKP